MDDTRFADLVARHRSELHVHCYRMLGSFDDAEDLVQETFARAWRSRDTYQGWASVRAWLYRIATNACLTFLDRRRREPQPAPVRTVGPADSPAEETSVPWLQPYPDRLLDQCRSIDGEPAATVEARETIELAFLVAIQHLPPRQRAVLILRDVVGLAAAETAAALDLSVAAVKSALQRARATLRRRLPTRREAWRVTASDAAEQALLRRYLDAHEQADPAAMARLLRDDVRLTMPPEPICYIGREAVLAIWAQVMVGPGAWGRWHTRLTRANRQPAAAHYLCRPGDRVYRPANLDVLRIEDGVIAAITGFPAGMFGVFGLPDAV